MAKNNGKQFESAIRKSFEKVPNVSIDRIPDQVTGFRGSKNICDFMVYKYPHQYYIECKSVHGNTLPFSNIRDYQWEGLLEKSNVEGIITGIICWWVDKDKTVFIPIQELQFMKTAGIKSIRYDTIDDCEGDTMMIEIKGKKKRIYFDYDMEKFLNEMEDLYG